MKIPKYFIGTMQQALDVGLNPFAFQLMAESFADNPEKFGDENLALVFRAHNGQQVWFLLTKTAPKEEDFDRGLEPAERADEAEGSSSQKEARNQPSAPTAVDQLAKHPEDSDA
jgi:hypothetical protein